MVCILNLDFDCNLKIHDLTCFRVEPVIYETMVVSAPSRPANDLFLRTFYSRPSAFFAKNVKRLCLANLTDSNGTFNQATQIVSACSGITELLCWAYPESIEDNLIQFLVPHRLQKLSVKIEALWGLSPPSIHKFDPHFFPSSFLRPNSSQCESIRIAWA